MYNGKKVLITGGRGFIGRQLERQLLYLGSDVVSIGSKDFDLRERREAKRCFDSIQPEIVFHLAADVGGIKYLNDYGADIFENNLLINTNVAMQSRLAGVSKLINIATVNCYPNDAIAPYQESVLYQGMPAEPVTGYAYAKRAMVVHSGLARRQYGLDSINLILDSVYGPGESFDPDKARVIPANVARFCKAKQAGDESVVCWGTGSPLREFLYVTDAVKAIVRCGEEVTTSEPVNIGTGAPISIKAMVECIADTVGYRGEVNWDTSKPDGQKIRYLSTDRLQQLVGWKAEVDIQQGIERMVEAYSTGNLANDG